MITALLVAFTLPWGCYTLDPATARELVDHLGTDVLRIAEMQNRRAGVPPWWLQTKES